MHLKALIGSFKKHQYVHLIQSLKCEVKKIDRCIEKKFTCALKKSPKDSKRDSLIGSLGILIDTWKGSINGSLI